MPGMLHVQQPQQDQAAFALWANLAELLPGFARAEHFVAQPHEIAGVRDERSPVGFRSLELLFDHRLTRPRNTALKTTVHLLFAFDTNEDKGDRPRHEPDG